MSPDLYILIVTKSNTDIYNSPLISGLLGIFGVFVGFLLYKLDNYLKERKELRQYEYILLSKTKYLLDENNATEIKEFLDDLKIDLKAQKLRSFKMILDKLAKVLKSEINSSDRDEIDARLNQLKKNGLVTRICTSIKDFFSR